MKTMKGFTLLEMLTSIAITMIVITVVFSLLHICYQRAKEISIDKDNLMMAINFMDRLDKVIAQINDRTDGVVVSRDGLYTFTRIPLLIIQNNGVEIEGSHFQFSDFKIKNFLNRGIIVSFMIDGEHYQRLYSNIGGVINQA